MKEPKTKRQNTGVAAFIESIPDNAVRRDCQTLADMMSRITNDPGDMWGTSIAGFGTYRMRYADGHEAEWLSIGFSPRKGKLTIYVMDGFADKQDLLARLGRHSTGKGCLYVKRLSDIDLNVLEELLREAVQAKGVSNAKA